MDQVAAILSYVFIYPLPWSLDPDVPCRPNRGSNDSVRLLTIHFLRKAENDNLSNWWHSHHSLVLKEHTYGRIKIMGQELKDSQQCSSFSWKHIWKNNLSNLENQSTAE